MAEVKQAPAKKANGNKTTEIIIGTAATKLTAGLSSFSSVIDTINKLPEVVGEYTLKVTDLEDKIGGLDQEFKNKVAQNQIEIKQAFERDKESFVSGWLQSKGLETISSTEATQLREAVANADANLEAAVKAAEGRATAIEKSNSANALKIANLEHEKKEADNTATIKQLQQQNQFLEQQMKNLQSLLDSQMKNETERAKYAQISTLNIGGTTQGR